MLLIVGSTGFIGRHVCAFLQQQGVPFLGVGGTGRADVLCDIHDAAAVDAMLQQYKPAHMVHLAWCAGQGYAQSTENLRWLRSSIHLLESFYRHGGQRFIGTGSCFEYAPRQNVCAEAQTPARPATLYGKTKLALGLYLESCATAQKRSWAWCRPFYMTGPGEAGHRLVPAACASMLRDEDFAVTTSRSILDYMDVRDVSAAMVQVLFSTYCGPVNIGTGQGISVFDLLQKLRRIVGGRSRILCADEENAGTPMSIVADTRVLHECIGFTPRYALEETLSALVQTYKAKHGYHKEIS